MFTGIIEEAGTVKSLHSGKLTISASAVLQGTKEGDSIAVNGVCLTVTTLTVTTLNSTTFSIDIMPETLRRSNLGVLHSGDAVNLERALAADGRFGGHFVQGHVDGTGKVSSMLPEGEAVLMKVTAPSDIMRYVVEKGFIAVDGASLTVAGYDAASFTVSLVGYTRQHTTLGHKKSGDVVNLEIDIIAKYVEKLKGEGKPGVSREFLGKHGFLAT